MIFQFRTRPRGGQSVPEGGGDAAGSKRARIARMSSRAGSVARATVAKTLASNRSPSCSARTAILAASHRLLAEQELLELGLDLIDLRLPPVQFGGAGRLALPHRQFGEAVKGGPIGWIDLGELLERTPFGCNVSATGGEPGGEPVHFRRLGLCRRQMIQGLSVRLGDSPGRHRPVEPSPPGRDVFGVATQADLNAAGSLVELALADRQIGLP